jgi:aryl-alcohol dehydrogenase-like predicted oxidoreductase
LNKKQLGNSALMLPPIMFGGNVFGWTADPVTSLRLLDALLDAGLNAIDTADAYSRWVPGHAGGESEAIIGVWLKQRGGRDKVIIASKCGLDMGPVKGTGLSKAHIVSAVEDSLVRLQTDYIDLYQAHRDDEATPLEETLEAFGQLVKQGKARVIGASNYSAARLSQALEVSRKLGLPRFESLQPLYNLARREEFEGELEQLCLSQNIGVINYYSLAAGFLTGKYRPDSDLANIKRSAAVQRYSNPQGFAVVDALRAQAERLNATPAQVAIAWLIARPSITAPIASATSLEQLDGLVKAAQLSLDREALEALDAVKP